MSLQTPPSQTNANALKYRVLLVEENEELAKLVMTTLTKVGMVCYYAPDANSGMESFKANDPHIVLLNLGLPRLGGVVMCPLIRETSTVPIAVLSVRTRKEDQLHALKIGADDFITMRPPDEQILVARVLTLLRRTYCYLPQSANGVPDTGAIQSAQSQLPAGWATCEVCNYMGPQHRFEKRDAGGNQIMSCPHCNHIEGLRFEIS
jgi:DNA-binding response OmpR family regulator